MPHVVLSRARSANATSVASIARALVPVAIPCMVHVCELIAVAVAQSAYGCAVAAYVVIHNIRVIGYVVGNLKLEFHAVCAKSQSRKRYGNKHLVALYRNIRFAALLPVPAARALFYARFVAARGAVYNVVETFPTVCRRAVLRFYKHVHPVFAALVFRDIVNGFYEDIQVVVVVRYAGFGYIVAIAVIGIPRALKFLRFRRRANIVDV